MPDVGIMTWFQHRNYGSALQAVALSETIKKVGYSPIIIKYYYSKVDPFDKKQKLQFFIYKLTNHIKYRDKKTYYSPKRENKFDTKMLKKIVIDTLVFGDGALKINYDPNISDIAILEWVDGSKVDFKYQRGRLTDIIFKSYHEQNNKVYLLEEDYGYGYITYKLYYNEKEVNIKKRYGQFQ